VTHIPGADGGNPGCGGFSPHPVHYLTGENRHKATDLRSGGYEVTGGLNLDYGAVSAGAYAGFDRFGRIANQKWQNTAGSTIHDGYGYAYDRVGNRTSRDLLMTVQPATPKDEFYVYDGLDRLSEFRRGSLTGSPLSIAQAASNYYQQWCQRSSETQAGVIESKPASVRICSSPRSFLTPPLPYVH
jgi:hypothetical protein